MGQTLIVPPADPPSPPGARPENASLSNYTHRQVAAAIDSIEKAAGGRESIVAALVALPPSDDLAYVVGLIADPRNDARTLSDLCRAGQIPLGELLEAFKQGAYAKMFVEVMAKVSQHTLGVVEDVMVRAQPHFVTCTACRGRGEVPQRDDKNKILADLPPVPCESCAATGKLTQLPDLDRQKLALDLAQVLPKKTPMVAVDNRSVHLHDATPGGFAKLLHATDQILHRSRPQAHARPDIDVSPVVDADPDPE